MRRPESAGWRTEAGNPNEPHSVAPPTTAGARPKDKKSALPKLPGKLYFRGSVRDIKMYVWQHGINYG